MKPINFDKANRVLNKPDGWTDEECKPLPVWTDHRRCVSCWELSWKDRIKAVLYGRVWLSVSSGSTQPPVLLQCEKEVLQFF